MTTITKLDTNELWDQFQRDPFQWYRNTVQGMREAGTDKDFQPTLGHALEFVSPRSDKGEMDAFGRMMKAAGIVTKTDLRAGYLASTYKDFTATPASRALFVEFFSRKWKDVSMPEERATLLSSDSTPGSWQRPYAEAQQARWDQRIEPAIPLSELVGITTPIAGQDYRALYLTYNAAQLRKFRVGETAEIPTAVISSTEYTINLKKYGRGLTISYEDLRRTRVDRLAFMIQMMAVQSEVDKVSAALDVLVNGDGNTSTAAQVYDINGDFGQTAGALNLSGWLQFEMAFTQPYVLTTALMRSAQALELRLLNTGSGNQPLGTFAVGSAVPNIRPINRTANNIAFGWTSEAPASQIVGFDNRFALEMVVEIGGEIAEMERFITNQTQTMVMTEVMGFAVPDIDATKILDVST